MNQEMFAHTVATETAKAFTSSNMPEYMNESGSIGFANDFSKKYFEAYEVAINYYNDNKAKLKSKWLT